eukprot:m.85768 g.85768  ORF g.85768 m.85768 type:complete len:719 (+) comp36466_c0_seq1:61-2217(+)
MVKRWKGDCGCDEPDSKILKVNFSDAGVYQCNVTAGIYSRLSDAAKLAVFRSSTESCSMALEEDIIELPEGCHAMVDEKRVQTIDVGKCRKSACAMPSAVTNQRPYCGKSTSCCLPIAKQPVTVTCDGSKMTFQIRRVTACQCGQCLYEKTTVVGRVHDAENEKPIHLVRVIVNGRDRRTETSKGGYFSFTVDPNVHRVVVEFKDIYHQQYADAISVVPFRQGEETYHEVYMQRRQPAVEIDVSSTVEIPLSNVPQKGPGAILEIKPRSFVSWNGSEADKVRAEIQYIDPRNKSNINAAWGELNTIDPRGQTIPLDTFGMFKMKTYGPDGTPLDLIRHAKIFVDIDELGVPVVDGKPLVKLYTLESTGIWLQAGDLDLVPAWHPRVRRSGRRLAVGRVTTFNQIWNLDYPASDVCQVKVRSYDHTGQQIGGVVVSMAGYDKKGKYYGIRRTVTDKKNGACVQTKCNVGGSLSGELSSGGAAEPKPPPPKSGKIPKNHPKMIHFNAADGASIYSFNKGSQCEKADVNQPHYAFTSANMPTKYTANPEPFDDDSWHFYPQNSRQYCFMRIRVGGDGDAVVQAMSFAHDDEKRLYGWRNVVASPDGKSTTVCLEYRCSHPLNQPTSTRVHVAVTKREGNVATRTCRRTKAAPRLRPLLASSSDKTSFVAPTNSWGSSYGLYADYDRETALARCCAGNVNPDGTCEHCGKADTTGNAAVFAC